MQTQAGKVSLVDGQQSYVITFPIPFAVVPTSFLPSIFIPDNAGEVLAVSVDLSALTRTGVTVWLSAPPSSASNGGYVSWRASNVPVGFPTQAGQVAGNTALVVGQQSYQITFPIQFASIPTNFQAAVQMVDDSGEVFYANPDLSTLTPRGVVVYLSGTPTAASAGSRINWLADGQPVQAAIPDASLTGRVPLASGERSYAVRFSTPFAAVPTSIALTVMIPGSSGEVLDASVDWSSLTAAGFTIWLNGDPTNASLGGFINWTAQGTPITTSSDPTSMTVVQLFHRMARRAKGGDFTKLSMTEQTDLVESANAALQRLYDALPAYFRELTEGFILPGPLALTNVDVIQHSKVVPPNTFTKAQTGATVRLDGDPQWNQVLNTGSLMNPYMGATGTVAGTVYGDAIYSDIHPLDRIIGNPRFSNQGIYPINPMNAMRGYGQAPWLYQQSIGVPLAWWVQTFGASQGHEPFVVLKFAPLPNQAYPVNIRMGFWPKRLTLTDYQNAATVVCPRQFIEPCLLPLCIAELQSTPIWESRSAQDDERVQKRADEALQYLADQTAQVGAPSNRVFCPIGF